MSTSPFRTSLPRTTEWRFAGQSPGTQHGNFLGHPASGTTIDVTGINVQMADEKIQEIWVNMDPLGEAEQLGWIESLPGSRAAGMSARRWSRTTRVIPRSESASENGGRNAFRPTEDRA